MHVYIYLNKMMNKTTILTLQTHSIYPVVVEDLDLCYKPSIEEVESYWWLAIVKLSYYFNDRIVTCVPQPNPRCSSQMSNFSWSVYQPVPLYVPVYCAYHHTLASAYLLCQAVWVAFVVGFCCSALNISNTMCGVRNSFRLFRWFFEGWCFVQ